MINSITDEFVLNHQFSWQPDFSVSDSVVIQVEFRLRFCWGDGYEKGATINCDSPGDVTRMGLKPMTCRTGI